MNAGGMTLAALLLGLAPAAHADPVKDKPVVTLDPAQAYVLYRSDEAQPVQLLREPTDEDIAAYRTKRAEALAKEHKRYERRLASWQEASKAPGTKAGSEPVEPTGATLAYPPLELGLMVAMGPFDRFAKSEDHSVYLESLPPGTYTVYGPVFAGPDNVMLGSCLCMGSVRFRVEKGVVTDLGTAVDMLVQAKRTAKLGGADGPRTAFDLPEGTSRFAIVPATAGQSVDPRIASFPVRPADYSASGKMTNWYGIEVDRLNAMPGVLGYDRDAIVDLRAGRP